MRFSSIQRTSSTSATIAFTGFVYIVIRHWVTSFANIPFLPCYTRSIPANNVFSLRDWLKVIRVHACGISTKMVEDKARGYWPFVPFVHHPVSIGSFPVKSDAAVASGSYGSLPKPASISGNGILKWRFQPLVLRQEPHGLSGNYSPFSVCSRSDGSRITASTFAQSVSCIVFGHSAILPQTYYSVT